MTTTCVYQRWEYLPASSSTIAKPGTWHWQGRISHCCSCFLWLVCFVLQPRVRDSLFSQCNVSPQSRHKITPGGSGSCNCGVQTLILEYWKLWYAPIQCSWYIERSLWAWCTGWGGGGDGGVTRCSGLGTPGLVLLTFLLSFYISILYINLCGDSMLRVFSFLIRFLPVDKCFNYTELML